MKKLTYLLPLIFAFIGCESTKDDILEEELIEEIPLIEEYGYTLNDFNVIRDTIRPGDTFGVILDANGVPQQKIFEVANKFKDSFDVRRIVVGKPYVLLNSKDSLNTTQVFIYEKNKTDFAVVDFRDSVNCYNDTKPIRFEERVASGVITSSLSETMQDRNLSPYMTDRLANIFAWTVNFFHLQEGDRFKVVYTEKFINDTISAGLEDIKAAYFEHRGKPLYAFNYQTDSINNIADYYDDKADNLRRAFLKSPIKFNFRISSRYNLNRRIKYYGYKLRPHKGTDFAAPLGTPILATADGTVTKSEHRGGNGNYVKIKHNSTFETQYLHMKKRNVRVGEYVRQGDVIGWIGMTGNTGGPHVCYRFWKNGKQVDPFKEDLPFSKPLPAEYHEDYFQFMHPLKDQLDCIEY
ncbi:MULTISPECIES: peptidoglycan DD-metalloendopeptidase family protein [Altibacter]|uniref:peptidoglycan DD-metalloendopeptidase family protein n=1 Tax=Altibacter TaxID=1535231 RepID=UPI00068CCAFD|nr:MULTISPECIES: peptidoglycan DD-metalloendopeptidase family protein [Altibacter]MCW8980977.1 peptidoglycan DD-metalloendopeptidase family protein [Altibacter sp.]MCW9038459.1 peptidoglycan DD-metalloendopeptidase family protein [Altibacter sp.]